MIFHLFSLAFVILKLTNIIAWSWFFVFAPSIFIVGITLALLGLAYLAAVGGNK